MPLCNYTTGTDYNIQNLLKSNRIESSTTIHIIFVILSSNETRGNPFRPLKQFMPASRGSRTTVSELLTFTDGFCFNGSVRLVAMDTALHFVRCILWPWHYTPEAWGLLPYPFVVCVLHGIQTTVSVQRRNSECFCSTKQGRNSSQRR
jgi:hypothetical protein